MRKINFGASLLTFAELWVSQAQEGSAKPDVESPPRRSSSSAHDHPQQILFYYHYQLRYRRPPWCRHSFASRGYRRYAAPRFRPDSLVISPASKDHPRITPRPAEPYGVEDTAYIVARPEGKFSPAIENIKCDLSLPVSAAKSTFISIRFGLLVGIGGGVPSKGEDSPIRLGDVVVSVPHNLHSGVVQYDFGKLFQVDLSGQMPLIVHQRSYLTPSQRCGLATSEEEAGSWNSLPSLTAYQCLHAKMRDMTSYLKQTTIMKEEPRAINVMVRGW